jgi:geranylgeranylglycerol-phosphate geranylgeranyltransferase
VSDEGSQMIQSAAVRGKWYASARQRLIDLVVLARLPSCLAGGASVVLGIHLARGQVLPPTRHDVIAMLGITLAVAAANVLNDVCDVDVDALDKPNRPIPSGRVSSRAAFRLACFLAVSAAVCSAPLGSSILLFMIVLLALAAGYSFYFKNTVLLGNCVVALCASSPILFGAAVVGVFHSAVFAATALAFTFMLTYETLKTIADRDSDAAAGLRTFATAMGIRASINLLRTLIAILTVAACCASVASSTPVAYLAVVVTTFVLPAWSTVVILGSYATERSMRIGVFLMRIVWFLGIGSLWLLR